MSAQGDRHTIPVKNSTSTQTGQPSPEQSSAATAAEGELSAVDRDRLSPAAGAVAEPPGEHIPRLARPPGAMARKLPTWDLEPPAFLVKRGEAV